MMGKTADVALIGVVILLEVFVLILNPLSGANTFQMMVYGVTFSPLRVVMFLGAAFIILMLVTFHLKDSGEYAHIFYLLSLSTVTVWILNSGVPNMDSFLAFISEILQKIGVHASIQTETAFYLYILVLLLLITSFFYSAPRRSRELGFIIFGVLFSAPFFRSLIYPPTPELIGITAFMLSISLVTSLVFSPKTFKLLFQTLLLSVLTVVAVAMEPWNIVLPVAFILTFPRKKRNIVYVILVLLGFVAALRVGIVWSPRTSGLGFGLVFSQLLLPIALIGYSLLFRGDAIVSILKNSKGPTPFLVFLLLVFLIGSLITRRLLPYAAITLTILSIRLVFHTRDSGRVIIRREESSRT